MKKIFTFLLVIVAIAAKAQHYPFPQHTSYHTHIKPNQFTQDQLDSQVKSYYDAWKAKYLINGCESNHYYVFFDSGNTNTVSEAMGYGMMIVPLMAGYDPDAKTIFDGLFRYFKAHPSHIMPHLMAWKQITGCVNSNGPDSATDGDIDIAFGLLLAHAQWGSDGSINYFQEALLVIKDLMGDNASEGDINQDYASIKLGDWVQSGSYMTGTRTSDFITDHFRAFGCAIHDTAWYDVINQCYNLIDTIQTSYSPQTGLLPDFIIDVDNHPKPANPNYLEGDLDGNYSYNACRDPWRLANDYLISGDERARDAVLKIDHWLVESAEGSTNNVHAGYYLDGSVAAGWSDNSFTAPFTVGAMLDTANQEWLNKLYSRILQANTANGGYYDNTLRLLSMITISGNYWVPSCDILNSTPHIPGSMSQPFELFPIPSRGILTVKLNESLTAGRKAVEIVNNLGQTVCNKRLQNNNSTLINLSNKPKGIYFILLKSEDGVCLGKRKFILK